GSGNLTGTKALALDAKLGELAFNGGPTKTVAVLVGSPARDSGSNPTNATYDQRGANYKRSSGSGVDMGAFELQVPPVVAIVINNGAVQRSRVTEIRLVF